MFAMAGFSSRLFERFAMFSSILSILDAESLRDLPSETNRSLARSDSSPLVTTERFASPGKEVVSNFSILSSASLYSKRLVFNRLPTYSFPPLDSKDSSRFIIFFSRSTSFVQIPLNSWSSSLLYSMVLMLLRFDLVEGIILSSIFLISLCLSV